MRVSVQIYFMIYFSAETSKLLLITIYTFLLESVKNLLFVLRLTEFT